MGTKLGGFFAFLNHEKKSIFREVVHRFSATNPRHLNNKCRENKLSTISLFRRWKVEFLWKCFSEKNNVILLHHDELENLENILTNKNLSENEWRSLIGNNFRYWLLADLIRKRKAEELLTHSAVPKEHPLSEQGAFLAPWLDVPIYEPTR